MDLFGVRDGKRQCSKNDARVAYVKKFLAPRKPKKGRTQKNLIAYGNLYVISHA